MLAAVLFAATIACEGADSTMAQWRLTQVVDGVTGSVTSAPDAFWAAAEGAVPAPVDAILRHLVDFDQTS